MFPLGLLTGGDKAEVVEIISGKHHGTCHTSKMSNEHICARVEDMGIRIGKTIKMLNNEGRGPLLLKVDESRIAISRGMAMKIIVRKEA